MAILIALTPLCRGSPCSHRRTWAENDGRSPSTAFLRSTAAQRANAMPPQIIPRIDPAGMPIVPVKTESVPPHRRHGIRPWRSLVHRQQRLRMRLCLTRPAPGFLPLLMARRTGACVPKPGKSPLAPVPIFPVNFETRPLGLVHANFRRRLRIRRKLPLLHPRPARLFLADKPDSFVTHLFQCIARSAAQCIRGCPMSRI